MLPAHQSIDRIVLIAVFITMITTQATYSLPAALNPDNPPTSTEVIRALETFGTEPSPIPHTSLKSVQPTMSRLSSSVSAAERMGLEQASPAISYLASVRVGSEPFHLTYDSVNRYVYVSNYQSNNISVIDGTESIGSVNVGTHPYLAAFDGQDGFIYVPNEGSNNVSIINGIGVVGTVSVGTEPISAIYDEADRLHLCGELRLGRRKRA